VAVSGGADSTALLVALASLAHEHGLALVAAHLHHGLRGADADADLAHVRALCARLGVSLRAARWDTRARMRREGLSGEAGLRALRRRFLHAAARAVGAAAIATAHTADDQLETLLMRLARGTSLVGLGAMRPRRGAWLKPMLEATRLDLEHDLVRARIAWREDASNQARAMLRNRIRHDVVPALARAAAPDAALAPTRARLARRAAAAAADARAGAAAIARRARALLARAAAADGAALALDAAALARAGAAVRDAALRRAWKRANPGSSGLTRPHLEALVRLLRARRGARVELGGGWSARRERERIVLARAGDGRLRGIPSPARADAPRARTRPARAPARPTFRRANRGAPRTERT
jgi:tRNA(Ile)-lysidine synthase